MSILDKISWPKFGKKHKQASGQKSANTNAKAEKGLSRKARKEKLAGVIDPTPYASAIDVLQTEPKLKATDSHGNTCYIAFLVNTDDPCIGGINKKRKNNEEIGSIISVIQNDRLQIFADDDMLKQDQMLVLPTKKTIDTIGEFMSLRDANLPYQMALVYPGNQTNVDIYEATMSYPDIKRYLEDKSTTSADLLQQKGIITEKPKQMKEKQDKAADMADISASAADIDPSELTAIDDDSDEAQEKHDQNELMHDSPDNSKSFNGASGIDASSSEEKQGTSNDGDTSIPAEQVPTPGSSGSGSQPVSPDALTQGLDDSSNAPADNGSSAAKKPASGANAPADNSDNGVNPPKEKATDSKGQVTVPQVDFTKEETQPKPDNSNNPVAAAAAAGQQDNTSSNNNDANDKDYLEQTTMAPGDDFADDSSSEDEEDNDNNTLEQTNSTNPAILSSQPAPQNPAILENQTQPGDVYQAPNNVAQSDITDEDAQKEISRTLYRNPWNLDVSTKDLDGLLSSDNSIVPFDENRQGWLGQYVNQIAKQANQQLASVHQDHIREAKQFYLDQLTKVAEDIRDKYDDQKKGSEYYDRRQNLEQIFHESNDHVDRDAQDEETKLRKRFETNAQQAGESARVEATESYKERHRGELQDEIDGIRGKLEHKVEAEHKENLSKLTDDETKAAQAQFDLDATKVLQDTLREYKKKLKSEAKLEDSYRKRIIHYVNNHRKEESKRAEALAAEVKEQKASKKLQKDYEARIDKLMKDSDNRRKDYEKQLQQAREDNKKLQESLKADYESRLQQAQATAASEKKALQSRIETMEANAQQEKNAAEAQAKQQYITKEQNLKAQYENDKHSLEAELANAKLQIAQSGQSETKQVQNLREQVRNLQSQLSSEQKSYNSQRENIRAEISQRYQQELSDERMENKTMRQQIQSLNDTISRLQQMQSQNMMSQMQMQNMQAISRQNQPSQPSQPMQQQQPVQHLGNSPVAKSSNKATNWMFGIVAVLVLALGGGMMYNNQQQAQRQAVAQQAEINRMEQQWREDAKKQSNIRKAVADAVKKQKAKDKKKNEQENENNDPYGY